jgi:hypothetical protein
MWAHNIPVLDCMNFYVTLQKGCVIPTSYYPTSILHQDILGVGPTYMRPTYMRPTCIGFTPYVSWCMIDVE